MCFKTDMFLNKINSVKDPIELQSCQKYDETN